MRLPSCLQEDILDYKISKYNPEIDPQTIDTKSYLGENETFGENLEAIKNAYPGIVWEKENLPSMREINRDNEDAFQDYYSQSLEDLKNQALEMGFILVEMEKNVIEKKQKIRKTVKSTRKTVQTRKNKIDWGDPVEAAKAHSWGLTKAFKYYPDFIDN